MALYLGNTRYKPMVNGAKASFMIDESAPLPYDAEIEYLESTGTQYINTGYRARSTMVLDIKFSLTSSFVTANTAFLFGAYLSGGSTSYSVAVNGSSSMRVPNGTSFSNINCGTLGNTQHILSYAFGSQVIDGNTIGTYSGNASSTPLSIWLFGRGSDASNNQYKTEGIRIYYCQMVNDGQTLRDFIPVRVGNTGYMYDRVSGQLFGNDGTGSFILGNDKNT